MALPSPPPPADLVTAAKRVNRAMFFVGAACFVVAARFLFIPDELARTSIGRALPGMWDEAWSILYLVGGALIMVGVAARLPRLELPGITLATTATIANGVAIFITNGSRAWSQLPLYVLALWVFDGRGRDLRDLPRERRGRGDDPMPGRVERRTMAAAPIAGFLFGAQAPPPAGPSMLATLIVAVLGGGIFTAIAQLLLYRPQRRKLEGELSQMSVETARGMLAESRTELAETRQELNAAEDRIKALETERQELESERRELRDRVAALEDQARKDHETIAGLLQRR